MKKLAVLMLVSLVGSLAMPVGAAPPQMVEGKDYLRLKNAAVPQSGQKIEILEFFSYGCPHCNDLEPYLQTWMKTVPADVQFHRVPVIFQPRWKDLAKVYYTLDAMGEDAKLSPQVFTAIHTANVPLYEDKAFFDWAASKGLDRAKVVEIYGSFGTDSKLKRALVLAQEYNVQSVPTIIVDGKFMTASDRIGGHANVPAALDALIAKARTERKS